MIMINKVRMARFLDKHQYFALNSPIFIKYLAIWTLLKNISMGWVHFNFNITGPGSLTVVPWLVRIDHSIGGGYIFAQGKDTS